MARITFSKKDLEEARAHRKLLETKVEELPDGIVKDAVKGTLKELKQSIAHQEALQTNETQNALDPLLERLQKHAEFDSATVTEKNFLPLLLHNILVEMGYSLEDYEGNPSEALVPRNWRKHEGAGVFTFRYKAVPSKTANSAPLATDLLLKCVLLVDSLLEVVLCDVANQIAVSATLSTNEYKNNNSDEVMKSVKSLDLLRAIVQLTLDELASKLEPRFHSSSKPKTSSFPEQKPTPRPSELEGKTSLGLASVGSGDAFPKELEVGGTSHGRNPLSIHDRDMEVGMDHPMFTQRMPPPGVAGPVPGARFDPYGPVPHGFPSHVPPNMRGQIPGRAPPVFGEPDADHVEMPGRGGMDPFSSSSSSGFGPSFNGSFGGSSSGFF